MKNDSGNFKQEFKKRLYGWTLHLIQHIRTLKRDMATDVIGKQLLRSSTSVLANYIEASSASSKKDFVNYFTHSLKSANESKVWLTLLRDTHISEKKVIEPLLKELVKFQKYSPPAF